MSLANKKVNKLRKVCKAGLTVKEIIATKVF